MPLILSIETSTEVCSVALHIEGNIIALKENYLSQSHSRWLSILIEQILQETGYKYKDLKAVAVSKGPGSYTGLRIGVSTAKGLCFALDIPLLAVNSLEALALNFQKNVTEPHIICPMIDARRMEVYCLLWQENETIKPTEAKIIDAESFQDILVNHQMIFIGNGALKCKKVIQHANASFIHNVNCSAVGVGMKATQLYHDQYFEDIAYFEPFYLKDFRVGKPRS